MTRVGRTGLRAALLLIAALQSGPPAGAAAGVQWVLGYYLAGEGDLERECVDVALAAQRSALPESVRVLVLLDRGQGQGESGSELDVRPVGSAGNWAGARLLRFGPEGLSPSTEEDDWGTCDMGSGDTLRRFVQEMLRAGPAARRLLTLKGHAAGWGGYTAGGGNVHETTLRMDGVANGIQPSGAPSETARPIDVLVLDVCNMASIEVAAALCEHLGSSRVPSYVVASADRLFSQRIRHGRVLTHVAETASTLMPKQLARHIVAECFNARRRRDCPGDLGGAQEPEILDTLVALDSTAVLTVRDAVAGLGQALTTWLVATTTCDPLCDQRYCPEGSWLGYLADWWASCSGKGFRCQAYDLGRMARELESSATDDGLRKAATGLQTAVQAAVIASRSGSPAHTPDLGLSVWMPDARPTGELHAVYTAVIDAARLDAWAAWLEALQTGCPNACPVTWTRLPSLRAEFRFPSDMPIVNLDGGVSLPPSVDAVLEFRSTAYFGRDARSHAWVRLVRDGDRHHGALQEWPAVLVDPASGTVVPLERPPIGVRDRAVARGLITGTGLAPRWEVLFRLTSRADGTLGARAIQATHPAGAALEPGDPDAGISDHLSAMIITDGYARTDLLKESPSRKRLPLPDSWAATELRVERPPLPREGLEARLLLVTPAGAYLPVGDWQAVAK